jgi:hypothetical protein
MNCHSLSDRLGAGGDRVASAFYFHEAEAAGSKRRGGFSYGAQVRYVKPVIQGYPENVGSCPGLDLNAVDR